MVLKYYPSKTLENNVISEKPTLEKYNLNGYDLEQHQKCTEEIKRIKQYNSEIYNNAGLINVITFFAAFIGSLLITAYFFDYSFWAWVFSIIIIGIIGVKTGKYYEKNNLLSYIIFEDNPSYKEVEKFNFDVKCYHYWQKKSQVKWWYGLDGFTFEEEVAKIYRKIGYDAFVTRKTGDGGIDIVLIKNQIIIAVQCKHFTTNSVSPSIIYKLKEDMKHPYYLNGSYHTFNKGIVVSVSGFTAGCYNLGIELIELRHLLDYVKKIKTNNNELFIKTESVEPENKTIQEKSSNGLNNSSYIITTNIINDIDWSEVESSNIKSIGYDKLNSTLFVIFKGNRTYQYFQVPTVIYSEFLNANSKGSYFYNYIREKFNYKKTG